MIYGSNYDDRLYGDAGDNEFHAGMGNDTLYGGAGSDTVDFSDYLGVGYWTGFFAVGIAVNLVTGMLDLTYDNDDHEAGLGPWAYTYMLYGIENVVGTNGSDTFEGNAQDSLTGDAGNNTLSGGAGNDALAGGAGSDSYTFQRGGGADSIVENDATAGNTDALLFQGDISSSQLWFRQAGNDLEVSVIGTADKAVVQNWYSGTAYHVEQIKAGDNKLLLDTQVQYLVQAMAAFAPPAMGQTSLTASQQTALAPVLAATWH